MADLSRLLNASVKAAISALQAGDEKTWNAQFATGARLYDDAAPRDLEAFSRDALGHERFTRIDKVSEDGLRIEGLFHSDRWGDFRSYFRFKLSAAGKIVRLDIGQL